MHEIADFTIDLGFATTEFFVVLTAVYTATDDAAIDVLIHCRAVHQRGWKADEIRESVFAATVNIGIDARRGPSADRHHEQVLLTSGPVEPVSRMRRHARDQKGRVVIWRQAAVFEEKSLR